MPTVVAYVSKEGSAARQGTAGVEGRWGNEDSVSSSQVTYGVREGVSSVWNELKVNTRLSERPFFLFSK